LKLERSSNFVGVEVFVPGVDKLLGQLCPVERGIVDIPQLGQEAGGSVVVVGVATERVVVHKLGVQLEQGGEDQGRSFHCSFGG